MRRFLALALLLSALGVAPALAIFHGGGSSTARAVMTDADCDNEVCTATGQICITGEVIYCCDQAGGNFDACAAGAASAGSAGQVIINVSGSLTGDAGFTYNAGTDTATLAGNLTMSTAAATVDGKNLDFVPAHTKVVHVCPSGCEYTTIDAACAGETSTAAAPLTIRVHAMQDTTQAQCGGKDHLSIEGDGPAASQLIVAGITGENGVLEMEDSTNWTVTGMYIEGHRALTAEWASVNAGTVWVYDNWLVSEGVASDEDCIWVDQPGSGSWLVFGPNVCDTFADGYTINAGGAGVTYTSQGTTFNRITGGANNGYFHAFEGIPCTVNISDDVVVSSGDYNSASTRYINVDGTQTGCASGAVINVSSPLVTITNTDAAGTGSVKFIDILSTATEAGNVNIFDASVSLSQASASGSSTGIHLQNTTTAVNVYGGRYRTSGSGAVDFNAASGSSFTLWMPDYTNETSPAGEIVSGDMKRLNATASAIFSGDATVNYRHPNPGSSGVLIENTDTVNDEASPSLDLKNGGASRETWKFLVTSSGRLNIVEPGALVALEARTSGNPWDLFGGLNLTNENASPILSMGDGTTNDTITRRYNTVTDFDETWVESAKRVTWTGPEVLRFASAGTAPSIAATGDFAIDTSAGQLVYYSGAERVLTYVQCKGLDIETPTTSTDPILLKAPYGMTITDIDCIVDPADSSESATVALNECDGTGDSCAGVDGATTIVCDNDGAADDGSLSNASIDSGDWISLDVSAVSGTVTRLSVTWCFTVVRQ